MNACVDVTRPNQTTGYHTIAENYAKPHHTIAKLSLTTQGYFEFEININVLGSSNLVSSIVKTVDSDPRIDSYCCIVNAGHHVKAGKAIVFWDVMWVIYSWLYQEYMTHVVYMYSLLCWLESLAPRTFWSLNLANFSVSLWQKTAFIDTC